MIKTFLIERRSWILFILVQQMLFIFIAYLDSAIPIKPILYMIFLSIIVFIIFCMIRYQRETKFYKSLEEWENNLDVTSIADSQSPFERTIEKRIIDQTEQLKQTAAENQMALEQEKDALLSWIHEVKTPLTVMHLIIDRIDDEKIKAPLTYEWLRIHLLLDQQLHQNRISCMENDLYIENVQLRPLLFKEIKTLQSWCIQKGIGFDVHLDMQEVLSDAKWLAFMIRQLLTNAVKYSEVSDISIKSYQQKDQTILEIRDFGRGIDPKDVPRIFDRGFTSTLKHQDRSATGMGLYLIKKAADSLHIKMHVQSKLGEGTTFTLLFPKRNDFVHITGM